MTNEKAFEAVQALFTEKGLGLGAVLEALSSVAEGHLSILADGVEKDATADYIVAQTPALVNTLKDAYAQAALIEAVFARG